MNPPPRRRCTLLALLLIAACEPASSRTPGGGEPRLGSQYDLRLYQGTIASLVPGWPFGDDAAWGVVRFSRYPRFPELADLRAPGLTGRAHVVWYDTTLGRVAPPGAPKTLQLADTVDGSITRGSMSISVASDGTGPGFSPPEPFTLVLRGRDSVVATLGDLRLTGVLKQDGSARGEWTRRATDGRVLAHGRFDLHPMDAHAQATLRVNAGDSASAARPVPDTIAR